MSVYPDASFLVSLFAVDVTTVRAQAFLRAHKPELAISDFACAEFASAIARRVRMGDLSKAEGRRAFSGFDLWVARLGQRTLVETADIAVADGYLRRLDLTLRASDAIHIAIAQRLGAELVTFDVTMAAAARSLKTTVVPV